MRILLFCLICYATLSIINHSLHAQLRPHSPRTSSGGFFLDKKNMYNLGSKLTAEVHILPSETPDSLIALTLFKFSYDLISFEKAGFMDINNDVFVSIPKFEIEFKDDEGIIRKREFWNDSVFTDNYNKTISKTDFIHGAFLSKLPAPKEITATSIQYDYEIRLSDKNISNIRKFKNTAVLDPSNKESNNLEYIGKPIYTYLISTDNNEFAPYILNDKLGFDSYSKVLLIPVVFKGIFTKYRVNCNFKNPADRPGLKWKSDFALTTTLIPEKNVTINYEYSLVNNFSAEGILLKTKPLLNSSGNGYTSGILSAHLPVDELTPGEYELQIIKSDSLYSDDIDTASFNFEIIWESMPVILQKPEYAIESMYYILTDEEYDDMRKGSEEELSEKILSYWQNIDPTPSTPYNESMTEYFSRVDYALFNFRTLTENNGVKTDR